MAPNRVRLSLEDSFDDLLGKPPLLKSEDEQSYRKLYASIEAVLGSETVLKRLRVRELTDNIWESQRLKRYQTALTDSALLPSLASLLGPMFGDHIEKALDIAVDYYGGSSQKQAAARKILDQLGITPEQIAANAMYLRSSGLNTMEHMISNRAASRNAFIKEHAREQKRAEKEKRRLASKDKVENARPRSALTVVKRIGNS
jgi:hypothetical protein